MGNAKTMFVEESAPLPSGHRKNERSSPWTRRQPFPLCPLYRPRFCRLRSLPLPPRCMLLYVPRNQFVFDNPDLRYVYRDTKPDYDRHAHQASRWGGRYIKHCSPGAAVELPVVVHRCFAFAAHITTVILAYIYKYTTMYIWLNTTYIRTTVRFIEQFLRDIHRFVSYIRCILMSGLRHTYVPPRR